MVTAQPFSVRSERRSERRAAFNHRPIEHKPLITIAAPNPLLDEGEYLAECTKASYEWANQWRRWVAILALEPKDYTKPYTGQLCKFFNLGSKRDKPSAGPMSDFRALFVEVNGAQNTNSSLLDVDIFTGHVYRITVVTVTKDKNGEPKASANWYSKVSKIHFVE
jgi:hypothetical protein